MEEVMKPKHIVVSLPLTGIALSGCMIATLSLLPRAATAQSGSTDYLYVLDSEGGHNTSHVLLLNTGSGKVVRTFPAASQPDEAVSPDGTRLYVTSIDPQRGVRSFLTTYDTHTGTAIAEVDNPDYIQSTDPIHSGSRMTMSRSGKMIYMWKDYQANAVDNEYMAVFDTVNQRFLPYHVPLQDCFIRLFLPTSDDYTINIACGEAVTEVVLDPNSANATTTPLMNVQENGESRFGAGTITNDGVLRLLTVDGHGFTFDPGSKTKRTTALVGMPGRWIRGGQTNILSPDQSSLFFVTGRVKYPGSSEGDQIVKVDSGTMAVRAALTTPFPVFSLCLSPDGNAVYALSPATASVIVVDANRMTVNTILRSIGQTPIFAIATPNY
jgi:DNA-binding beta-propeller fold protein YncE